MNPSPADFVQVNLGDRRYEITIASDALDSLPALVETWMARRGFETPVRSVLLVTDTHVSSLAAKVAERLGQSGSHIKTATLAPGEATKCLASAQGLYDQLIDMPADRQMLIVAVGGGVIGDLAGFVAATYARGLPFVQVPTTLLSQVDSSVGGKTGVNHPRGKNLIGAFYQPLGVFIDTTVLDSLPDRDYRSGLAEIVKYGVILDAPFFETLEKSVDEIHQRQPEIVRLMVSRSCRLKADVVEHDEFERTGLRAVLNFGHTFAHAFEALYGYGVLQHGEAVSIGMVCAARLAVALGRIPESLATRLEQLLARLRLPVALPHPVPAADELIAVMRLDKKSVAGQLRFILPTRLGHVETVKNVPEALVRSILACV